MADEPRVAGMDLETMWEELSDCRAQLETLTRQRDDWSARAALECDSLRTQLSAAKAELAMAQVDFPVAGAVFAEVVRERDELLKVLNGPEVIGLRAQLEEVTKERDQAIGRLDETLLAINDKWCADDDWCAKYEDLIGLARSEFRDAAVKPEQP